MILLYYPYKYIIFLIFYKSGIICTDKRMNNTQIKLKASWFAVFCIQVKPSRKQHTRFTNPYKSTKNALLKILHYYGMKK